MLGAEVNDYSLIASKESLSDIEIELKKMLDVNEDIQAQKKFLVEKES